MGSGIGAGTGVGATGIGAGMGSGIGGGAGVGAAAGGGSVLSTVGNFAKNNWRDIAGLAGSVMQSGAQTAAANRASANEIAYLQDQQRLTAARDFEAAQQARAALELQQREEQRAAQQNAYRQARTSAAHLNMQDASINRPRSVPNVSFSGGLRPSMYGAEGREAAEALNAMALRALLNPEPMRQLPDPTLLQPSAMQQAGAGEQIMSYGGAGLSGIGAILRTMQAEEDARNRQPQLPGTYFPLPNGR